MTAAVRRILWRPGSTAAAGLVLGIVATALVVHWTDPFLQTPPKPKPVPPALRTQVLNWNETWKPEDAQGSVNIQVATFSENKDGSWTFSAAIRNQTTKAIGLSTSSRGIASQRGLAHRVESPNPSQGPTWEPLPASRIQPEMPGELAPGESWSGVLIGPQKLPRKTGLFAAFGIFSHPDADRPTPYVTEHSFTVPAGR